jgi:Skp family chaperone for outer membrane proteins
MKSLMRTVVLVSVVVLAATACQRSKPAGSVAIIDLDRIATAMGWLEDLQKGLQTSDTEMRAQLDQVLRANLKAIDDAKTAVAAEAKLTADQITQLNAIQDPRELEKLPLSKAQRDKLLETVGRSNQTWQQAVNAYQQNLQARRQSLVLSYREKVRPVARRVAAARGMSIIFTPSDNLLYFEPNAADITDQVLEELQKNSPKPATK